ncbi:MAG TPA: hypothetical protein VEX70_09525 [Pyrinomonadaceae bacterium]|nr:hypothetical protein [Pyrinomonadaceae bacterium]
MKTIMIFLLTLPLLTVSSLAQTRLPTFDTYVDGGDTWQEYEDATECSFYCANFSVTERASSSLPSRARLKYGGAQAHDNEVGTAWVEGSKGYGVGEFLEYVITTAQPDLRVTGLSILNGYRKSKESWRDNSRVKRLKLYVNGKPHGVIELKDSYNYQEVKIGNVKLTPNGKTILRFEIMEVYKGRKYSDTAITAINLDGCCTH